jgi:hypothetical protein
MKPELPDSPALQDLLDKSEDDLRAEVEKAQRFRQAADTYLAWAQLSEQLRGQWANLRDPRRRNTAVHAPPATATASAPIPTIEVRNGRPSLRQAILLVLSSERERVWRKREIFEALKQSGWEPRGQKPEAQLATRLAEMITRGEVVRVSVGHYMLTDAYQELREASPSQGGKA